ncbi:MAG: M55 family metallopeptidase [Acidobacteria bacterium]|nr:M55 family metallopeptidase [Acidobacteriota bacterium]
MNNKLVPFLILALLVIAPLGAVAAENSLKILISVDMEGITGVVNSDHVSPEGKDYNRARLWMTQDVNAAIEGALEAGATEIIVNDSHGGMRNILLEKLHPAADLISGTPKPFGMMQGIDASVDAVIFIGYHAKIGTQNAILAHTMSSSRLFDCRVNGVSMSEGSLNAYLAGYFDVPVVFIAGDRAAVDQMRTIMNSDLPGVAVKEAYGRLAARNLSLERAHERIRSGVAEAVKNRKNIQPAKLSGPIKLEMEFFRADYADQLDLIPGVIRTNGRTVEYTSDDYTVVYKLMRALLALSST